MTPRFVVPLLFLVVYGPLSWSAESAAFAKCKKDEEDARKGCDKAKTAADLQAYNSATSRMGGVSGLGQSGSGASGQGSQSEGAKAMSQGAANCQNAKHGLGVGSGNGEGCNSCDPGRMQGASQDEKNKAGKLKLKCEKYIDDLASQMQGASTALSKNAQQSGDTKNSAAQNGQGQQGQGQQGQGQQGGGSGGGSPSGGSPSQNSKNDDPNKTQEPSSSAQEQKGIQPDGKSPLAEAAKAADCSGASGKMTDEQRKQCSGGYLNTDGSCKPGTGFKQCSMAKVNDFCAKGNNSCPSCKGMTAQALSSASTNDLKSMCSGSCAGDPALGPNLADACRKVEAAKLSPESLKTGSTGLVAAGGGASSGGGGSTAAAAGHGAQPQSLLDADKIKIQDLQGSREGGPNLAGQVDGGGGFGGYGAPGGGGLSSDEDSLDRSRFRAQSAGPGGRGPSSSGPVSATAKDVESQFGHNVISIVSEVLRNRCAQGQFLHCERTR